MCCGTENTEQNKNLIQIQNLVVKKATLMQNVFDKTKSKHETFGKPKVKLN